MENSKENNNLSNYNIDFYEKIMPQNIEAEESVLGSLITEKNTWNQVSDILTSECFYKEANKHIFDAVRIVCERDINCDIISLVKELRKSNKLEFIGGSYYISKLTNKIVSSCNIQLHAHLVFEQYVKRKLIEFSNNLLIDSYSEQTDALELFSNYGEKLTNIVQFNLMNVLKLKDGLREVYFNIIQNRRNEQLPGLKTGFYQYDKRSGGFQLSDLVVISGETSQGKTSLALNIARNIAEETPLAIYSLEMSMLQLSSRFTSMEINISGSSIMYNKLSDNELNMVEKGIGKIENLPIYLDDNSTSTIESIIASIRLLVLRYGIKLVVIDYLQLIESKVKFNLKEQETGYIVKKLKNIAKELNICVVLISQLNRSNNPKPTLSRLRDSGQIEQAADVVMFVYRPGYYGLQYDSPNDNISTDNTSLIDVAKGRNIGTFNFIAGFDPKITKFTYFSENELTSIKINKTKENEEPF